MRTETDELHLHDYLALVRRRKWWVLGAAAITFAIVALVTFSSDEVYQSRADVLIRTDATNDLFPRPAHEIVDTEFIRTIAAELTFVSGQEFRANARQAVGFSSDVTISQLALTDGPNDASIISFSARASTAERAAAAANGYAETYLSMRHELFADNVGVTIEEVLMAAQADLDAAQGRLDRLLEPTEQVEALAAVEADSVARATLIEQAAQLRDDAEAQRPNLERQVAEFQSDVTELTEALVLVEEPGAIGRVLNPAPVQAEPVSPNIERNLLIGALAAAIIGFGIGFSRDLIDQRVGEEELSLAPFGHRVLAQVPTTRPATFGRRRRPLDGSQDLDPYRSIRNALTHLQADEGLKTVAITGGSVDGTDGETVANLAQLVARSGQRVVVVSADFRTGGLVSHLGLQDGPGLIDLCLGDAGYKQATQVTEHENLLVMTAGQASQYDLDLLTPELVGGVLDRLREGADIVIVDCAPVLADPNAELVASQVDGVIVVVNSRQTRADDLTRSLGRLTQAGSHIIGLVATHTRQVVG